MTVREQLASDMAAAIGTAGDPNSGYGETFEWGGRAGIPCVRRDTPTMMEMQEEGGFIDAADYWLVVAKAHFPDGVFPAGGDLINNGRHKIKPMKGQKDPFAPQLVLHIGGADQ